MGEIKYMLKPDWVSWDAIAECQYQAHLRNRKKGLNMSCQNMTGEDLKNNLKSAYCFVALDGEKVVGTDSFIIRTINLFGKKNICYHCYNAILPEYQGTDIYFKLTEIKNKERKKHDIYLMYFDTAESNKLVQKLNKKSGFKYIKYKAFDNTNYYSVYMAKWTKKCPFPDWFLNSVFKLSEIYVKTRFKPGRIKRFGI